MFAKTAHSTVLRNCSSFRRQLISLCKYSISFSFTLRRTCEKNNSVVIVRCVTPTASFPHNEPWIAQKLHVAIVLRLIYDKEDELSL